MIAKPDISNKDSCNKPGGTKTPENRKTSEVEKNTEAVNPGKLILDATCVPANIHSLQTYGCSNRAREAFEEAIDVLYGPLARTVKKPKTYKECARKDYLNVGKKKCVTFKEIRKGIGQQLGYIKRDLGKVKEIAEGSCLELLDKRQYRNLLVYRQ
jgi:transposase, IS5 family